MLSYKTDHQGSRPFPRDQTMTMDGTPRLVPVTTVSIRIATLNAFIG